MVVFFWAIEFFDETGASFGQDRLMALRRNLQEVTGPLDCKGPEIRANRIAEARRSSCFTVPPPSTISNNEVLMRRDVRALSGALYRTSRYQSRDTGKLLSDTVRLTS